jgi:tetratricopeptide (TPR) repeat protein
LKSCNIYSSDNRTDLIISRKRSDILKSNVNTNTWLFYFLKLKTKLIDKNNKQLYLLVIENTDINFIIPGLCFSLDSMVINTFIDHSVKQIKSTIGYPTGKHLRIMISANSRISQIILRYGKVSKNIKNVFNIEFSLTDKIIHNQIFDKLKSIEKANSRSLVYSVYGCYAYNSLMLLKKNCYTRLNLNLCPILIEDMIYNSSIRSDQNYKTLEVNPEFINSYLNHAFLEGVASKNRNELEKADGMFEFIIKLIKHKEIDPYSSLTEPFNSLFFFDKKAELDSIRNNLNGAIENYSRCVRIAKFRGDKISVADSYYNLAVVHSIVGDYDKFNYFIKKGIKSLKTNINSNLRYKKFDLLGHAALLQGKYDEAVFNFEKIINEAERLQKNIDLMRAYLDLTSVYYIKKDYKKALYYLVKFLPLSVLIEEDFAILNAYDTACAVYVSNKSYSSAETFNEKLLEIANNYNSQFYIARAYYRSGSICLETCRYDEAIRFFLNSRLLLNGLNQKRDCAFCLFYLGVCYFYKNNLKTSAGFLKKSCTMLNEIDNRFSLEIKIEYFFALISSILNNPAKIKKHLKRMINSALESNKPEYIAEAEKYYSEFNNHKI